ncbi:conjugal transfer protein TraA [Kosakonia radicincitans UMEnt01/12]|uniref:type IV conjugative transfer system pilin TraA n=1 Tax=Kosakonia radicincitans TaxID=283686 RepID=UPI0004614995|nr:type IV conjugative transfer system pilin TraA [Kosakonia radicincitans]KDE33532.1 conjugal transfer protein TraA [Kosakonia radicincitans UMEnt01/12]
MFKQDNALNVRQGWAVASLFRKAREYIQFRQFLKNGGLILISLMVSHYALASGNDLLAPQDSTVTGTFGHGSSLEKYLYYAEIFIAVFLYVKARSPLVFVGLVMVIIFTRLGFSLAG